MAGTSGIRQERGGWGGPQGAGVVQGPKLKDFQVDKMTLEAKDPLVLSAQAEYGQSQPYILLF